MSFKVNDRVFCIRYGWGKVTQVERSTIEVNFDDYPSSYVTYLPDGRAGLDHKMPFLYSGKPKITVIPELEKDTPLIVWNYPGEKHKRYFAKWSKEVDKVLCYPNGQDSWTFEETNQVLVLWNEYEVVK